MSTRDGDRTNGKANVSLDGDALVALLNELIAMCHNGQKGFALASASVESEVLHQLLQDYAQQRGEYAERLREEVLRLGGTPEMGGDLAGGIHRLWLRLKRLLAAGDAPVVAECLAGDGAALEVYEQARQKIGPGQLEDVVEQQYEAIRAARARLQSLQRAPTGLAEHPRE
jgi:uncharacterized protein (TIGR02284 family)